MCMLIFTLQCNSIIVHISATLSGFFPLFSLQLPMDQKHLDNVVNAIRRTRLLKIVW